MEEFNEEDILWLEEDEEEDNIPLRKKEEDNNESDTQSSVVPSTQHGKSAPILIPSNTRDIVSHTWTAGINYNRTRINIHNDDDDDDGDGDDYDSIVPPHILLQQRNDGKNKMVSSVCFGHGRTLKGRDLLVTRDSILRRTGFLEK